LKHVIVGSIDTSLRDAIADAVDFVIPIVQLRSAAVIVNGVLIAFSGLCALRAAHSAGRL
jgi:hypothetical protein